MKNSIYVTTSIPYVNSRPHIGFALELVQADVIARYHRLLGNRVHFQTGTDDNAFKNVLSARKEGIAVQDLVDRNSRLFGNLATALDISADSFVRTSETRHKTAVHHLWQHLKEDDLYVKRYKGLYCVGCEDFYLEKDLVDGRCPDHGTEPVGIEESNYFLKLSGYQAKIIDLLESDKIKIVPEKRKNEILNFVSGGLQDISVSRDSARSGGWGIQVPSDASQTIYVWVDALINYISGLGYGSSDHWEALWSETTQKIHVIGKNVWKFHAILWPALLLSAELPLPDEILVHGFVTENGQKISKSRGNSIDPQIFVEEYGVDAVRYYLLRAISPFEDGDFSPERLRQVYNSDLANGLGNLVNRLITLFRKGNCSKIELAKTPPAPDSYHEHLKAYEFNKTLISLWEAIGRINRDIDQCRPWELLKAANTKELSVQLSGWFGELYALVYWLEPFLPSTSRKTANILSSGRNTEGKPLFPRAT